MNASLTAFALVLGLGANQHSLENPMATDLYTFDESANEAEYQMTGSDGARPRLFGILGGRRGPSFTTRPDTVSAPVNPRIVRDLQWEIGRAWSVDPDRIQLMWGSVSGEVPDRIVSVRILGTGSRGHWIALLAPADSMATPARVRIRAGVERLIPVAARKLERGEVLRPDDIAHDPTVVWGPPADDFATVEPGWIVNRVLAEGEELKHPAVAEPNAVESGEEIEIVWKRGAVAVSLSGVALGSVPVGEQVRVRTDTGRRLEGTATSRGVVVVGRKDDYEW